MGNDEKGDGLKLTHYRPVASLVRYAAPCHPDGNLIGWESLMNRRSFVFSVAGAIACPLCVDLVGRPALAAGDEMHWSYDGAVGPDFWGGGWMLRTRRAVLARNNRRSIFLAL